MPAKPSAIQARSAQRRPIVRACTTLLLAAALALALGACGGGGGGGGGSAGGGTAGGGAGGATSEGTLATPLDLVAGVDLPHTGFVDGTKSYYRILGLVPGEYAITMTQHTGQAAPFPRGLHQYLQNETQCGILVVFAPNTSQCIVTVHGTGELLLDVVDNGYHAGGTYTFDVQPADEEGTPTAPVVLSTALANLPHTGSVAAGLSTTPFDDGKASYFRFDGLTPGDDYSINITTPDVADIFGYQTAEGFAYPGCYKVTSSFGGTTSCFMVAKGTSLLFKVRATYASSDAISTYSLDITDSGPFSSPQTPEGTPGSEVPLPFNVIHAGAVDATQSYYTTTPLVGGLPHQAYLDLRTFVFPKDDAALYVYNTGTYATPACSDTSLPGYLGLVNKRCSVVAPATGQLWTKVDGSAARSLLNTTYSVIVTREPVSEGLATTPVELAYTGGTLDTQGEVSRIVRSYYHITGLTPSTDYQFAIYDEKERGSDHNGTQVWVFPDTTYSLFSFLCSAVSGTSGSDTCVGTATANGDVFLRVENTIDNDFGSFFKLRVRPAPLVEGASTAPIAVPAASLPFAGQTGDFNSGGSFYQITGLTPSTAYEVTFRSQFPSPTLKVFTTSDFSNPTPACSTSKEINPTCAATSDASGNLWVQASPGGRASFYALDAFPMPGSGDGTSVAPQAITLDTTFAGQVPPGTPSDSYYTVSGLTPGQTYLFRLDDISVNTSTFLWVGATTDFTGTPLCQQDLINGQGRCYGVATASSTNVLVSASFGNGGNFKVTAQTVLPNEGTGTVPIDATGLMPLAGTVGRVGSYYVVTGLTSGTAHTVSLTGLDGNADLYVFGSADLAGGPLCSSKLVGTQSESCSATVGAAGSLWIVVDGLHSDTGAHYSLNVN